MPEAKPRHSEQELRSVTRQFQMHGEFFDAVPIGKGHINDTYLVTFTGDGAPMRYVLQRINHNVFPDPPALMENIERVTTHLSRKVADHPDAIRRALALIPAHTEQGCYLKNDGGHYWRAYYFIERTTSYDSVETPEQAFQAARAFGFFQAQLSDLPVPPLHETIADFHNTPKRLAVLREAIEKDPANRAAGCQAEIDFALHHREISRRLIDADLPSRVTHNDTKINNVMLENETGEGICVIDLDTVMPGLVAYDFGDMVRSASSPAAEDERDLSKVRVEWPLLEALVRGYQSTAGDFLTEAERSALAGSGIVLTYETGIRFLTDYLNGDNYFKIHRPHQNLDRCRAHFRLMESIMEHEEALDELVAELA